MIALAKAGFRAIAPDFRGYGLSDQPAEPEKTTFADLIDDLIGILDALEINKVPTCSVLILIVNVREKELTF